MSMLALKLYSDPEIKCDFIPMAIFPPKNYKRGLNFGKKYRLIPGKIMTAAEFAKNISKPRIQKGLKALITTFINASQTNYLKASGTRLALDYLFLE